MTGEYKPKIYPVITNGFVVVYIYLSNFAQLMQKNQYQRYYGIIWLFYPEFWIVF